MTTRVATFPLRLPVSLKAALEQISERDGTSINQFLVVAAAEKVAALEAAGIRVAGSPTELPALLREAGYRG